MRYRIPQAILLLCAIVLSGTSWALDREAFTFTNYQLQVQLDPAQHGLAATGFITLRNDSGLPQKNAVLQISSSLTWISIKLMPGEKTITYVTHPYESDVDHTGTLSEAVVTLPEAIARGSTMQLEVTYSGQVLPDATRIERLGTSKETAAANDWDEVSTEFTAVRGAGYVAWYPVAMEAASLKDGHDYGLELGKWRARKAEAQMVFDVDDLAGMHARMNDNIRTSAQRQSTSFFFDPLGYRVPVLFAGNFTQSSSAGIDAYSLTAPKEQLQELTEAAAKSGAVTREWFGAKSQARAEIVQLPQNSAIPFESGPYLFMPFSSDVGKQALEVRLAHTLAHAAFYSPRPWIYEGLAGFAQALVAEQQGGREAALAYMKEQMPAMAGEEKENQSEIEAPSGGSVTSLVAGNDELLYRTKAMYVWWMLRDMLGDAVIKGALAKYVPEQDKDTAYIQHLLEQEAQARRVFPKVKLEQFFDDWVYRDRGLPDFSVKSTYTRKLLSSPGGENYMATITVANSGGAGAEIPVTVDAGGHERVSKKLAVPAHGEASIRIPTVNLPTNVTVNDGSVPEWDSNSNSANIAPPSE